MLVHDQSNTTGKTNRKTASMPTKSTKPTRKSEQSKSKLLMPSSPVHCSSDVNVVDQSIRSDNRSSRVWNYNDIINVDILFVYGLC